MYIIDKHNISAVNIYFGDDRYVFRFLWAEGKHSLWLLKKIAEETCEDQVVFASEK